MFYMAVRGLNEFDRENGGVYSPLNGAIAAEIAWSEHDKE